MIRRFILASVFLALAYLAFLSFRLWFETVERKEGVSVKSEEIENHKVYSFSFSKYATTGKKELEIEGDSANILAKTVALSNVIAKAYANDTPVTVTADEGMFDKSSNTVHLQKNVIATTQEGARLLSPSLNIHPTEKSLDTADQVTVRKDNIDVQGTGASGDSQLKTVQFHKNVTVVIQNTDPKSSVPTVITCDGPLDIDYTNHIAYFKKNVVTTDHRGKLAADKMDVYYDQASKQIDHIVATGNVVITTPEGNATYSEELVYYAKEGRVVIGGGTEAVFFPGSETGKEAPMFLSEKK